MFRVCACERFPSSTIRSFVKIYISLTAVTAAPKTQQGGHLRVTYYFPADVTKLLMHAMI